MHREKVIFCILLYVCLGQPWVWSQSTGKAHDLRRDADRDYDKNAFVEAEEAYRKANILDEDEKGVYNLGNAVFHQQRYEDAAKQYEQAAEMIKDPQMKSRAYYNLGNAHFMNEKYDASVQAYKKALLANPKDLEAKQNLLMAMRELQTQQQQQQQQQDQQQDEQEENNQQQQQPQQQQSQQQQQQTSESQDGEENQQELEQKLTKEQALQLLEIIAEEDKKVQEKLRKQEAGKKKSQKDW